MRHLHGSRLLQQQAPAARDHVRNAAVQGFRSPLGHFNPKFEFKRPAKRQMQRLLVATTEVRELEAPARDVAEQEQQEQEEAAAGASFDWLKQWYPMRVVKDLEPAIPHAVQLLGMDLVLWRDKGGAWRCFEDRCPHRLAALSEGRIDSKSGDLYCNYHGWSFEGSGQCSSIPQLSAVQKANPQVLRSPRACAVPYPTRVAEGLLWVWASAGPDAQAQADAAEWKGLAPQLDAEGEAGALARSRNTWYRREFPGSYLGCKENSFNDPSHDTVLHHNTYAFLTRDKACSLDVELLEMTGSGYVVRSRSPYFPTAAILDKAVFPAGNSRAIENGPQLGLAYTTPLAHNRTQLLISVGRPPLRRTGKPVTDLVNLVKSKMQDAFPWAEHLLLHSLMDADIPVQSSVARNRAKDPRKVYTPAEADVGPRACWSWVRRFGGGGPFAAAPQPLVDPTQPQLPRRVLLDRFGQHTKHCSSCRQAHATLSRLLPIAQALAAALAVAAVAVVAGRGALVAGATMALAAAAAATAWLWLRRLVQRFVFVDYDRNHVSQQP